MAEYLDLEKVFEAVYNDSSFIGTGKVWTTIAEIETADVQEARHGHWIISSDGYYPYCSECKNEPKGRIMTDWCPNCGAQMHRKELP